jgi:hypothetical protein
MPIQNVNNSPNAASSAEQQSVATLQAQQQPQQQQQQQLGQSDSSQAFTNGVTSTSSTSTPPPSNSNSALPISGTPPPNTAAQASSVPLQGVSSLSSLFGESIKQSGSNSLFSTSSNQSSSSSLAGAGLAAYGNYNFSITNPTSIFPSTSPTQQQQQQQQQQQPHQQTSNQPGSSITPASTTSTAGSSADSSEKDTIIANDIETDKLLNAIEKSKGFSDTYSTTAARRLRTRPNPFGNLVSPFNVNNNITNTTTNAANLSGGIDQKVNFFHRFRNKKNLFSFRNSYLN